MAEQAIVLHESTINEIANRCGMSSDVDFLSRLFHLHQHHSWLFVLETDEPWCFAVLTPEKFYTRYTVDGDWEVGYEFVDVQRTTVSIGG